MKYSGLVLPMRDEQRKNAKKLLAAILPRVMKDNGWEARLEMHSIFPDWEKVVDETTATYAQPLKIVKETLWIEVENSAWMQQFQYQKIMLLKTINGHLKNSKIKDIRFVLPHESRKAKVEEPKLKFVAPPRDEVEKFEEQSSFIEDEASREALVRLWYLSKACRRE